MQLSAIRRYRPDDAPALWDVYYSAIHQVAATDYSQEQIDAWAPSDFDPSKWAERMRGIAPFVAERDGTIIGYADVQPNGYIDHFFRGRRGHSSRSRLALDGTDPFNRDIESAGIALLRCQHHSATLL